MAIRAKFHCNSVTIYVGNKNVNLTAVYGKEGENADYSKYTPSGSITMTIDNDTKAGDYFVPGKEYYLTFDEAETKSAE